MRKATSWLLAFGVFAGAACLGAAIYLRSDENWRPVELPMPGVGLQVAAPFHLATAGRFQVNATVPELPSEGAALRERPAVTCDMVVQVEGPSGFRAEHQIHSFGHSGDYTFGGVQFYSSGEISLPMAGPYTFRLVNRAEVPHFQTHGAMVSLERIAEPTGWVVGAMLARGAGFTLLFVTAAILVWRGMRRPGTHERAAPAA